MLRPPGGMTVTTPNNGCRRDYGISHDALKYLPTLIDRHLPPHRHHNNQVFF